VKSGVSIYKKEPRARKHMENARLLLTNISYTNAYTHDHALQHLAAACADDDPSASRWSRMLMMWCGMYSRMGED
jgi:hypothetical protein